MRARYVVTSVIAIVLTGCGGVRSLGGSDEGALLREAGGWSTGPATRAERSPEPGGSPGAATSRRRARRTEGLFRAPPPPLPGASPAPAPARPPGPGPETPRAPPRLITLKTTVSAGPAPSSAPPGRLRGADQDRLVVVVLRELRPPRLALAAVLLVAGNVLLLSLTAPIWTDGTAYVLLATGLWAGEYTLSKHTLRNVPSGTVGLARMGFGGAFLLAYVAGNGPLGSVAAPDGTALATDVPTGLPLPVLTVGTAPAQAF